MNKEESLKIITEKLKEYPENDRWCFICKLKIDGEIYLDVGFLNEDDSGWDWMCDWWDDESDIKILSVVPLYLLQIPDNITT